jgi:hypothetical protein
MVTYNTGFEYEYGWMVSGFVVVMVDEERYVWLCFCRTFTLIMFNPSTGSPSSLDTNLLSPPDRISIPPSIFYSRSTHTQNRPITPPPDECWGGGREYVPGQGFKILHKGVVA